MVGRAQISRKDSCFVLLAKASKKRTPNGIVVKNDEETIELSKCGCFGDSCVADELVWSYQSQLLKAQIPIGGLQQSFAVHQPINI
jgi:hypothetical protein